MMDKVFVLALAAIGAAVTTCGPDSATRWTITNGEGISISAGSRVAGAIDSVTFRGKQYINACDHGRELQLAIQTSHGECYNPTEAGSEDDSAKATTTSKLLGVSTQNNILRTTSKSAFWMRPGECESSCGCAVNSDALSSFEFDKAVEFNPYGIAKSFRFQASVHIPVSVPKIQIESPTGYQNAEFTKYYSVDPHTGAITVISNVKEGGSAASGNPIILATQDNQHAMGAISAGGATYYAVFNFSNFGSYDSSTNKWSIVRKWGAQNSGTVLNIDSYICVGTTNEVAQCIKAYGNHFGIISDDWITFEKIDD